MRALASPARLMQVPPAQAGARNDHRIPQRDGLDTLAIFPDGRLRYINQSEGMAIFEASPPALIYKAEEMLRRRKSPSITTNRRASRASLPQPANSCA